MAFVIKWSKQANKGLDSVIEYLEFAWTAKEILNLESNIHQVINQIKVYPELFPKSDIYEKLHKASIDKNNYLIYRINYENEIIEIINFRGTEQEPKY